VSSQWPKTFLAALQQHAVQQPRGNAITILDDQTKPAQTLTFRKYIKYLKKKMSINSFKNQQKF
jgi:acyl-CoA synthetase (AMP-forming)/AMP-acid ligase II